MVERALSLLPHRLVEINNNYIFNDDIFQNDMVSFLIVLEDNMNLSKEQIAKFLYWPKYALRKSFDDYIIMAYYQCQILELIL